MSDNVALKVSHDEALVLFEMLQRFSETNHLSLRHNAEFIAISNISGQLERVLVEPFDREYSSFLSRAQSNVASGFEGVAPGVVSDTYVESVECTPEPSVGVLFIKVVGMPQGYPVELDASQARALASRIIAAAEQVESGKVGKSSAWRPPPGA